MTMLPPPRTVPPDEVVNFVSVETAGAKEQGCKGFIVWELGSPATAVWRIEWDNPEGAKNTSTATLTPQSAGFASQDVIGQGEENVPASFTISGGPPAPGPSPKPGPGPSPGPDPLPPPEPYKEEPLVDMTRPFEISGSVGQGGKNVEDDVQQVQTALNRHGAGVDIDGKVGPKTIQAIKALQSKIGLRYPDGLVEVGGKTATELARRGGGG